MGDDDGMSGWGEDPEPGGWGGPAAGPGHGPAYGGGYGPGGYGPGYGPGGYGAAYGGPADGGWAPYPGAGAPGLRRRRIGLWLGLGSVALTLLAYAMFVAGLFTIFLGGAALWVVAFALGAAGTLTALLSLVLVAIARGCSPASRLLSAIPAVATLLLVGPGVFGSGVRVESSDSSVLTHELTPHAPAPTPPPPGTDPVTIVDEVEDALWMDRDEVVCVLLAEAARTDRCVDDPVLEHDYGQGGWIELIRSSARRALVSYDPPFDDGPVQRIRLVHEAGGWRVLDLPGRPNECVDTAKDPFRCPVRAIGATG